MPRICAACGRGSQMEWKRRLLRGHYNPTHKKRKYANLQWLRLEDGSRVRVCARCKKTAAKRPDYIEKAVK